MTMQFDFITNDKFRSVLTADSSEMYACADVKAWKAVHILAGSIIEAVIIDYLISENHISEDKALKLHFNDAVELATKKNILSEKVHNLSIVVKNYRNLVHPGRSIRLEEIPTDKDSKMAISLVEMICDDLSERKSSHGYTAAQIIGKIRRDFHVRAILENLLTEMSKNEIKDLLTKVIPETYLDELQSGFDNESGGHVLPTLKYLFHIAYRRSDEDIQREVSLNFVRILKEGDSDSVIFYSQAFWWAHQLKHLHSNDAQVVKKHFFSRIKDDNDNPNLIRMLSGIGTYLCPKEISELVDILVRILCRKKRAASAASQLLHHEHNTTMNPDGAQTIISRLEFWQTHFNETGRPEFANIIEEERTSILLDEIPF